MKFLFIFLLSLNALPWAQASTEIQYLDIYPDKERNLSLRETWETSSQFCYRSDEHSQDKLCYPISQMSEVKIREQNDWSLRAQDRLFIEKLPPPERDAANDFAKLQIRFLDIGSDHGFVAQIHFIRSTYPAGSDKFSQTIYAMGHYYGDSIRPVSPQIESMCFSNALERDAAMFEAILRISKYKETPTKGKVRAQMINDHLPLLKIANEVIRIHVLNQKKQIRDAQVIDAFEDVSKQYR